jgi:type II secretion system protein G
MNVRAIVGKKMNNGTTKNSYLSRRVPGFTLIELLIVITIIGILASLVLANMAGARERARDAQRKADLRQVQTALRLYYNDFQGYPAHGTAGVTSLRIQHAPTSQTFQWGEPFTLNSITYMGRLPLDPVSSGVYSYYYWRDGTNTDIFCLWSNLENKSDDEIGKSQVRCGTNCTAGNLPAASFLSDQSYIVCNE